FQVTAVYPCGETQPTNVVVDVVSSATLNISPQTICESGGSVDLRTLVNESPAGGTFVFSGHPNISGNNFDPSGLAGSTVSITVDYSVGSCSAPTGTLDITISNVAAVTVPASAVAVCESAPDVDLTALVTATPSGGTFTFTGAQVTGNMFDPTGLSGLQTITVDYSAGGCSAPQKTFQLDVKATASITTSGVSACENGGPVNLLALVSGSPSGGAFTFTGAGVSGNTFNPSGQSGTVTISVDYNAAGCTASGSIAVTVLNAADPMCTGGNCASVVIVPIPTAATCTNSDGKIVFRIKPFTPAINNTGIKISIDGISSTNLSISRTIFNDTTFNALPVGTYDYSIEYGDPSCVKTGRVTIDQSGTVGAPVASNISGPVCPGTATGSLTLSVPGENGNILEWSLDGGLTDPFKPFTAGGQITGIPAGPAPSFEQVISVRRNISDPCYASVTVVVTETVQAISATFNITGATCNGNDGAINNIVASGGNVAPYTFSIDGGQTFQSQTSFNGLAGGTYALRVRDAALCEKDFTAIVTFPGFINSIITKNDANCSNNGDSGSISVRIDDAGVFEAALTTDQFNQPPDSVYLPYTNPSISFDNIPRGQYYVYIRSSNAGCPTRSAPIDIFGVYAINFDFEPDCNGSELSLGLTNITGDPNGAPLEIQVTKKLSSDPPEIIYKQFPANGQIYLDHDLYNFLQVPGEYQIRIIQFQNDVVCNLSSRIADLTVPGPLTVQVGEVAESYPDIPTGKLDLTAFSGGIDPYSVRIELDSAASLALPQYATSFEEPLLNGDLQFEMEYDKIPAGRYQVVVTDSLGCTLTFVARVPLDEDLFIPNVFTPNGDGSNDVFFIRNLPAAPAVNQLIISNRWGKEVFVSRNYQNNWDGEGISDGLYFYRLKVQDGEPITGWVEIMRGPKP
ncbi:MAG TPA: gliding motility-associated C-terminal domain-containing protein, partial [Chryseosolibacter sp.]